MCDAMVAVALAGSIFFSIDPSAARWRVALYLVLTIAPLRRRHAADRTCRRPDPGVAGA